MNYVEVIIEIEPFSDDYADLVIAQIEELPYESFATENGCLKAYIPEEKYSSGDLRALLSAFTNSPDFRLKSRASLIHEQNWNILWESNFPPISIGGKCTIKASFHKGLPKTKYTITIDPKMAFGTGHHQTTSLMVESLLEAEVKDKRLLDVGCGTGILSILAAKMGAVAPVHAIDIDPVAVASTEENVKKNRVQGGVVAFCGDASLIQTGRYDILLANINRNIILQDIGTYSGALTASGRLYISGFYSEDLPMILEEAKKCSLEFVRERRRDNWMAAELKKVD
ncbi:MAG: 50S ribosomal protein L11 methyltransferase [Bacteroidales bacterium]|nr:50S ribosomal protein L11 methyltransferase [Bacteroidales bacterium]